MWRVGGGQRRGVAVMMGSRNRAVGIGPWELTRERQETLGDAQKVYVGNIEEGVTEDRLEKLFSRVGKVSSAKIIRDGEKPKGYGFVTYIDPQEATNAILYLNGSKLDGQKLVVDNAQVTETAADKDQKRISKKQKRIERHREYKAMRDATIGKLYSEMEPPETTSTDTGDDAPQDVVPEASVEEAETSESADIEISAESTQSDEAEPAVPQEVSQES